MITPKEKAEELVDKFKGHQPFMYYPIESTYNAKQCALIAVEEIVKTQQKNWFSGKQQQLLEYWQEVKQEIEKL